MEAEITQLYVSKICKVHNFLCKCEACSTSAKEYQREFVVAYVRKGNFQFNAFRNELDACHGFFLINKPHYEYSVRHVHHLPDECTIFSIPEASLDELKSYTDEFSWFFKNPDLQSILIQATPETEHLHHYILKLLNTERFPRLWVETLITELLISILSSDKKNSRTPELTFKQKKYYLPTIENVKFYINEHFAEDLSLSTLADLGNMSVFHFNRLFKRLTATTPYRYLLSTRLQSAQLQLKHTDASITEIAFAAGFQSLEHFSATYRGAFGHSPKAARL